MFKKISLFAVLTLILSPLAPVYADCGADHGAAKAECPMGAKADCASKSDCSAESKADCASGSKCSLSGKRCELKSMNSSSCPVDPNGRCRMKCHKSNPKTNFVPGNKKH